MGKTVIILAPLVVGGALLLLAFWMGQLLERVKKDVASARINPGLHDDLIELVRQILSPGDLDQVAFLPEPVKTRAQELLDKADQHAANMRQAQRRRAGW